MERRAPPAPVAPVQSHESRPFALLVMAVAAVAIAVAKPWSSDTSVVPGPSGAFPSAATGPASVTTSGGPPGSVQPDGVIRLAGGGTLDCYAPPGWRLVIDTAADGRRVRTWLAVQPTPATGPLDPTVPATSIANGPVVGLGFCAPRDGTAAPASPVGWTAAVWRVGTGRRPASATRVAQIETDGGAGGLALASGQPGAPAAWAPGRYAIQFESRNGAVPDLWIILDLSVVAATGDERGALGRDPDA